MLCTNVFATNISNIVQTNLKRLYVMAKLRYMGTTNSLIMLSRLHQELSAGSHENVKLVFYHITGREQQKLLRVSKVASKLSKTVLLPYHILGESSAGK